MNDSKKELRIYRILAIIWTVNAVLWNALLIVSISGADRTEIILRAVTALCFTIAAVLDWISYFRKKKQ